MPDQTDFISENSYSSDRSIESIATEADIAKAFCMNMRSPFAPADFNKKVLDKLRDWSLIEENSNVTDYISMRSVILGAQKNAKNENTSFVESFRKSPWSLDDSAIEGKYTDEELPELFPRALEMRSILKGNAKFVFRKENGGYPLKLVERVDGKRLVFKIVESQRSVEDINEDGKNRPEIIPPFEAIKFSDGRVGVLIDFVNGHTPNTEDEKRLCLSKADQLLSVQVDKYDLWLGNFLVTADSRIYYVDGDVVESIAKVGYSKEVTQESRDLLEAAKNTVLAPKATH